MDGDTIRQKFIQFFEDRGHLQLPSLPLVPPSPDITTLFTIAGMQQMIGYFLGREEAPNKRLLTVQKAIRTVDIEEVGDSSHLTFLQMLGNFSVGDYFKHEAIAYTWEFLTETMGVPADRWWATIYPGDEDARLAWLDAGLPADRIGESEENWWSQGPVGPCGPDSEIYYDRGVQYGCGSPDCRPERECCDRFLETWNNVFMMYNRLESGELEPLPWNNIDTGMGFERLAAIVQGVETVYDTDLFQPIIRKVTAISGGRYGANARDDRRLRIIADHARAITFILADGVMPSSEGRGYVLRRLLRRAALYGRLLGIDRPFLQEPVSTVIETSSKYWTELGERREHILRVVGQEEARFVRTLARGLGKFEEVSEEAQADGRVIGGAEAFTLHDTYGFPIELTEELARERELSVDREGFEAALSEQQERGRRDHAFSHRVAAAPEAYAEIAKSGAPTRFTGYGELTTTTDVTSILAEGQPVQRASAGDQVEIVLAATPFYAESGGQVGDIGEIRGDTAVVRVLDTQRPNPSVIVHKAEVVEGQISVGDAVVAEVETERRLHILPHHSGTHLLHKALQDVLGPEATQAGSLVEADRLRFDFRWPRPLTPEEIQEVQDRVNAAVWANLPVRIEEEPYDDAIRRGAMALFGEKYGDRVRVVSMGDWSVELCGGTHVTSTGDIGLLLITSESGIAAGVRRIEAVAGAAAYEFVNDLRATLSEAAAAVETQPRNLVARAEQLAAQNREQEKRLESLTRALARFQAEALARESFSVDGFSVVAEQVPAESVDFLQVTADEVRRRLGSGIAVLGSLIEGKPAFTMAVAPELSRQGYAANKILRDAARSAGGGAGGTPEFAHGGGRDASRVGDVLRVAVEAIKNHAAEASGG
ncbi:MAG TPA: alanine--tRNA ligase [Chloroflexota bacterium]|nr:alanine--tRNA ligase [Chloroflexota bacterium]